MNMLVGGAQLRKCSEGFSLVEKCEMVHLWPMLSQEVGGCGGGGRLQLALRILLSLSQCSSYNRGDESERRVNTSYGNMKLLGKKVVKLKYSSKAGRIQQDTRFPVT